MRNVCVIRLISLISVPYSYTVTARNSRIAAQPVIPFDSECSNLSMIYCLRLYLFNEGKMCIYEKLLCRQALKYCIEEIHLNYNKYSSIIQSWPKLFSELNIVDSESNLSGWFLFEIYCVMYIYKSRNLKKDVLLHRFSTCIALREIFSSCE